MILAKSPLIAFKIKCANCGATAWRHSKAMVCIKCYWNKNCPRWLKQ